MPPQGQNIISFHQLVIRIILLQRLVGKMILKFYPKIKGQNLTSKHFQFINDKTYHFTTQIPKLKQEKKYSDFCINIVSFLPLILPSKKWKIIFDCWQGLLISLRMFIQSVRAGFCVLSLQECVEVFTTPMLAIMLVSFMFEMFINFNTGYFKRGVIITDRKKIVKHYLRKAFVPDVLAQIPLIYNLFINQESSYTKLAIGYALEFLIFLQYVSLKDIYKRLERALSVNQFMAKIYPLINLTVDIVVISHIIAILYYAIAQIQLNYGEKQTWIQLMELENKDWYELYTFSLYWSISTMVTILLFIPKTQIEKMFMIVAIIITCGMFAYAINTIGIILQDWHKKTTEFKKERATINRFLHKKKLGQNLKERIQNYIEYLHQQERESYHEETQVIMSRLSPDLKSEVATAIYKQTMKQFSTISNNFSTYIQKQSMGLIEEVFLTAGEILFKEGDHKDNSIYLLQNGVIQIYNKNEEKLSDQEKQDSQIIQQILIQRQQTKNITSMVIQDEDSKKEKQYYQLSQKIYLQKIKQGQQIGINEFFTGLARQFTAECTEPCSLLKISRPHFIKLLKNQTKDYETFCMIKDCLLQQNYTHNLIPQFQIGKCQICQSDDHQYRDCQEIQFRPNKKKMIYQYNKLDIQFRIKVHRRDMRVKVLNELEDIIDGLEEAYEDQELIDKIQEHIDFLNQCGQFTGLTTQNFLTKTTDNLFVSQLPPISQIQQQQLSNFGQNHNYMSLIQNKKSQMFKSEHTYDISIQDYQESKMNENGSIQFGSKYFNNNSRYYSSKNRKLQQQEQKQKLESLRIQNKIEEAQLRNENIIKQVRTQSEIVNSSSSSSSSSSSETVFNEILPERTPNNYNSKNRQVLQTPPLKNLRFKSNSKVTDNTQNTYLLELEEKQDEFNTSPKEIERSQGNLRRKSISTMKKKEIFIRRASGVNQQMIQHIGQKRKSFMLSNQIRSTSPHNTIIMQLQKYNSQFESQNSIGQNHRHNYFRKMTAKRTSDLDDSINKNVFNQFGDVLKVDQGDNKNNTNNIQIKLDKPERSLHSNSSYLNNGSLLTNNLNMNKNPYFEQLNELEWDLTQFDRMHSFKYYFYQSNCKEILERWKNKHRKKNKKDTSIKNKLQQRLKNGTGENHATLSISKQKTKKTPSERKLQRQMRNSRMSSSKQVAKQQPQENQIRQKNKSNNFLNVSNLSNNVSGPFLKP